MYFTTADIVRSSIVRMIEDEFDVYEENNTIKK
jgi:hypothetical protein